MQFVGAAQQTFNSFLGLVGSMMDTYCPNWKNPADRKSYILPPVCSFKNADLSDQDVDKIKMDLEQKKEAGEPQKSLDSMQRPIIDRYSENGEFVVFYALWALIQDKVASPSLAIHGLNLKNIDCYLQQMFPNVKVDIRTEFEAMMREYDFVLIGPKIGLIVIEVKSSHFTKTRDFSEKNKHLPDDLIKALEKQLDSFDPSFFRVCSGSETAQKILIRKILFTPNLKKNRFETWINKFDDATRNQIMDKFDGVTHWFSEDMDNQCDQKPPLYSTLCREIEKRGYEIPHEIFESYGLIISGLRSAVILHGKSIVTSERLSTSCAILKDAVALESHNPKRRSIDENAPNVVEVESKLVLLTPEQQQVLNGPNRQFIIGAPGTGKTIIIQAKVAQLLKEGKKVVIYAEEPYDEKYEKLFGSHGCCKIRLKRLTGFYPQLTEEFLKKIMPDVGTLIVRETLEQLSDHILGESMVHRELRDFDSIFIDDAFDWSSSKPHWKSRRIYDSISLMAIASSSKFRPKLIWVACDAFLNDSSDDDNEEVYKRILNQIIRGEQGDYFSTTILDRIMRSSESVFQAIYSTEVIQHLAIKPLVGHKIHGFYDSFYLGNLSLDDALLEIWNHTHSAVKKIEEDGFGYEHMAVITEGVRYEYDQYLRRYLFYKFRENGIPVEYNHTAWHSPGFLTLDDWKSVSSFEWPVVIYIAMFEAHKTRLSTAYSRYRACSRATMKLFEIIVEVPAYNLQCTLCHERLTDTHFFQCPSAINHKFCFPH